MQLNGHRIRTVARKEWYHILYDFRTLFILFLMPVVQLIMLGYALNLEIKRVDLAVLDYARSPESTHLVNTFKGSPFFHPFPYDGSAANMDHLFKTHQAHAAMIVPSDFDRQQQRENDISVQFLIDASDANRATLIQNYCNRIIAEYNQNNTMSLSSLFDLRSTIYFNPDQKSAYFFVPGIIAMILIMISTLLTSITIAREKEFGTIEQILVSPIQSQEIIIGKVLPYIALAIMEASFILLLGMIIFDVPFRGNVILLMMLTTLYIITALCLGLLISTQAKTQQIAMMMAITLTLLPTLMLSGLIFPIASMPRILQWITYLVPARYYLLIIRGIMLKGSGGGQLLEPILLLGWFTLFFFIAAIRRMNTTLER
ncbi:ABC transporter permease [bacterium]|nr:ABC transporter permease [bacterium]RQV98545.1 MAG: ABC transporter permease [bacterium]